MSSTLPILVFFFSLINIAYMTSVQHGLYIEFISEPSMVTLFLAYFAWTLMSYILKKFVIDAKGFGFKSAFTNAPIIGLLIYTCISISIMTVNPEWGFMHAFTDIIFGTTMFAMVTLIAVIFREYF